MNVATTRIKDVLEEVSNVLQLRALTAIGINDTLNLLHVIFGNLYKLCCLVFDCYIFILFMHRLENGSIHYTQKGFLILFPPAINKHCHNKLIHV